MGRISNEELNASTNTTQQADTPYYWYFGLAHEGDSSIVRIMDDSVEDLEPLATHPVRVKGKYRRISCLRSAKEPLDMCPLCAADAKLEKKVYIHLIEYMTAEDGSIVAEPRVWERPLGFINELKEYMADYAPLSDNVFKVKRTGTGPATRYSLIPLNPVAVDLNKYPKDTTAFENYKVLGVNVQIRDAENIIKGMSDNTITFETNKAPTQEVNIMSKAPVVEAPVHSVTTPVQPIATNVTPPTYNEPVAPVTPVQPVIAPVAPSVAPTPTPTVNSAPWETSTPRRTYTPQSSPSTTSGGFRPIRNA